MTAEGGWRARLAGGIALFAAAASPIVAYVGNLGFAPMVAGLGLVSAAGLAGRRRPWPAFAVLAAVALLAVASYGWGAMQPVDFPKYGKVEALTGLKLLLELGLYGAFVRLSGWVSPEAGRWALLILGIGFGLSAALLLVEAFGGAALYQWIKLQAHQATRPDLARRNVARATYAAALLLWPAALTLRARGWTPWAAFLGVATLAAALALRVDAAVLALAISTLALLAVRYGGVVAARLAGAVAAVLILAAPWVALASGGMRASAAGGMAKASWQARLEIWRFAAARIAEHPLGLGLDGSRLFPGAIPLHPHDMALQVWLELGAVGALLAAAFWALVFEGCARLARRDPTLGAGAAAAACAYLTIGALSFGVWQEWWLALGALTAAAVSWWARSRDAFPGSATGLYRAAP